MKKLSAIMLALIASTGYAFADEVTTPPPMNNLSVLQEHSIEPPISPVAPEAPPASETPVAATPASNETPVAPVAPEAPVAAQPETIHEGRAVNLDGPNPLIAYQKEMLAKDRQAAARRKAVSEKAKAKDEAKLQAAIAAGGKPVSITEYNLIKFGQPISKVVFPPSAPIQGKPVYVGENKTVMVKLSPDATEPMQVVIELADGSTHQLTLVPEKGLAGQTISVGGTAAPQLSTAGLGNNPNARYVAVLSSVLAGDVPASYERAKTLPAILVYDRLVAIPVMAMINDTDSTELVQYTVRAKDGMPSDLDPSQFYSPNVGAVVLSDTSVSLEHEAKLYIVWTNQGGAQ